MSRSHDQRGSLPPEIEGLITSVLDHAKVDSSARLRLESDLRDHFEDGLAAGRSAASLVEAFGPARTAADEMARVLPSEGEERALGVASWRAWSGARDRRPSAVATLFGELRNGARSLLRTPRFALAVMCTLALGVGANAAVFTVLEAVLLRPLGYSEPEKLVRIHELVGPEGDDYDYLRGPTVNEMRTWTDLFEGVGAMYTYRDIGRDLTGDGEPQRLLAMPVSSGFFRTLGASPTLGRVFDEDESFGPGEYEGGPPNVAVISHDLWSERFGADTGIVGRAVQLDGRSVEIVGVMPPGFTNPIGSPADLWTPQDMRLGGSNHWGNHHLTAVARLRDDVTLDQARARLAPHVAGAREREPASGEWSVVIVPLQQDLVGPARTNMLWVLTAAVALVLLSACVNAGNLVFARGLHRQRELALRAALGSARARLVTHLAAEYFWLALGGTLLGLALGLVGVSALLEASKGVLPLAAQPSLNAQVFGYGALVTLITMALFGVAPALLLSGVRPASTLGSGSRGTEPKGMALLRSGFVVAQAAVAVALIAGAGLLLRSFVEVRSAELGLETDRTLTFEVHLPGARYGEGADRHRFHQEFQRRVAALPSVTSVGATSRLPLVGRYHVWGSIFRLDSGSFEYLDRSVARSGAADVRVVTGDTFRALGIPVLSGSRPEDFREGDDPVVWLSRSVAEKLTPGGAAEGLTVGAAGAVRRVAGVVEDVASDGRGTSYPTVYVPHRDMSEDRNWPLTQVVRSSLDPAKLENMIRAELTAMDPGLVLYRPKPVENLLDEARAQDRFALMLMALFAGLAVLLAAAGTYGVLAGMVARRRKEIGIRIALGAGRRSVRWTVLRSALGLTAFGSVLGLGVAWFGSRWLATLLFGVSTSTPWVYALSALLVLALGIVSGLLPAQRATRIDPAAMLTE
ncbi:MAG: ADOP family duplicated permease [Acidobacteriota bacterium]